MQSKELTGFYRHWLDRVEKDDDDPRYGILHREVGLCSNLSYYIKENEISSNVLREMYSQFADAGLDAVFPFNVAYCGFSSEYNHEVYNNLCHKNEKRLQWVRYHV